MNSPLDRKLVGYLHLESSFTAKEIYSGPAGIHRTLFCSWSTVVIIWVQMLERAPPWTMPEEEETPHTNETGTKSYEQLPRAVLCIYLQSVYQQSRIKQLNPVSDRCMSLKKKNKQSEEVKHSIHSLFC